MMFLSSKRNMEAMASSSPLAGAASSANNLRYFLPHKEDPKLRGFDMNCLPQDADNDEAEEEEEMNLASSSSPSSFTAFSCPWLHTQPLPLKRDRGGGSVEPSNSVVEQSSSRGSDEEEAGTRKKLRLSKDQSALLEDSFREHSTLTTSQKLALSKKLELKPRQVEVWFQNRRARTKLKQTEVECEVLRRCCESLTEENRRLQKELQELRALKISPPCVYTQDNFMPLPAATLTMCPSCEKIASSDTTRSHHLAVVAYPPKPSSPAHRHLNLFLQPLGQPSAA